MKRQFLFGSFLASVVLGFAILAVAQSPDIVTVRGTVVDDQGQPVAGAVVAFHGQGMGTNYSTKTDQKGEFFQVGVRLDTYLVTVTKDGQQIGEVPDYSASSYDKPLKISARRPAAPVKTVPLTAPQKQALEELQKLAAAAPKKKDEKQIKSKLQAAQAALTAGSCDQVVSTLTEVTALDPMSDQAWAELGYCNGKAGKNDVAVADLEKAVAISPGFGGYHENLAISYAKAGRLDEGVAELASAIQVDPAKTGHYYLYTGLLLSQEGKTDEALAAYDKALAADPKLADAYYFKGVTLVDQAQRAPGKMVVPAGAVEAFKKYLELQPNGPQAASCKQMLSRLGG